MSDQEKVDKLAGEVLDKVEDAFEKGDGFFITISRINGTELKHYQAGHLMSYDDKLGCLEQAYNMIAKNAPQPLSHKDKVIDMRRRFGKK